MSGNGVKGMPMDLAERAGRILALPGGPAGALEALSSVRGEGRGEGEAMELLAIDGAATRILSAGEPRGGRRRRRTGPWGPLRRLRREADKV